MKKLLIIAFGLLILQSCRKPDPPIPATPSDEELFANNKVNITVISSNGDSTKYSCAGTDASMTGGPPVFSMHPQISTATVPRLTVMSEITWPVGTGSYNLFIDYSLGYLEATFQNSTDSDSTCTISFTTVTDTYTKGFFNVTAKNSLNTDSVRIMGDFEGYVVVR